ncbi:MAG: F-box protein [Gammaproteobacteria bacterium]
MSVNYFVRSTRDVFDFAHVVPGPVELPPEIWREIFAVASTDSVLALRQISRDLRSAVDGLDQANLNRIITQAKERETLMATATGRLKNDKKVYNSFTFDFLLIECLDQKLVCLRQSQHG